MSYEERRVRVCIYGTMSEGSGLLRPVPGAKGASSIRLHVLAAEAFLDMAAAVKKELKIDLAAASGWRKHRWRSRADYEQTVIKKYGSVQEGRKWLAYDSPHETGLAVDLGVGGLWPDRKTAAAQRKQPLHQWLVERAHAFGWHPYKVEPWHWEHPLSLSAYRSGRGGAEDRDEDLADDSDGVNCELDAPDVAEDEDDGLD